MNARLRVLIGDSAGETIEVPQGKLVIGRETDCRLQRESTFISRQHCVLLLDADTLRIRDLGSKNGTFVNGQRIGGREVILLDGDIVAVGEITFAVTHVQPLVAQPSSVSELQTATAQSAFEATPIIGDDTLHWRSPMVDSPATFRARPIQSTSAPQP
jgi:pSer/pThr/pTyr-binding forkhead associated (FHA) protein